MKTIDKDTHLKAFALYVMAKTKLLESREYEVALQKMLEPEDEHGHVTDLVGMDYQAPTESRFAETLRRLGVIVE